MALAGSISSKGRARLNRAEPATPAGHRQVTGCVGGIGMAEFCFMIIYRFSCSGRGRFGRTAKICLYERVKMARVRGVACIVSSARKPDDALDGPVFLEEE